MIKKHYRDTDTRIRKMFVTINFRTAEILFFEFCEEKFRSGEHKSNIFSIKIFVILQLDLFSVIFNSEKPSVRNML